MGFNKLLLCLNDAESEVNKDPKGWWEACKNAFYMLQRKRPDPKTWVKQPEDFGFGYHANGWSAVWEDHADNVAVVMVGGNCATVLGTYHNGGIHHTEEAQLRILKDVLDKMGYRVVRKSNRRADSSTKTG